MNKSKSVIPSPDADASADDNNMKSIYNESEQNVKKLSKKTKKNEESQKAEVSMKGLHDECKSEEKYLREFIEFLKKENDSTEKLATRLVSI